MSSDDTVGVILDVFAMTRGFVREAVEDVPEPRMTEQPGTLVNHPAWTLAHLNAYAGVLLTIMGDQSVPDADAELARFGYGTTPVVDPAAYPTKRELLAVFDERHARLADVIAQRHADWFPRPAPDTFQPHAPTIGHVAVVLLASHLPYHLGQLRQWRRAAGIAAIADRT